MNYFAHGRLFVEDPYFLAGTQLPDWLCVVDRRVRVRSKAAAPFAQHQEPDLSALARGVLQHHRDDRWFHGTAAFAQLNLQLARTAATLLPRDEGFRPSFLAHVLIEVLLDASLIADDRTRLDAYYNVISQLDVRRVQQVVETICHRPVARLSWWIERFSQERFLYDYLDDAKLLGRLSRVMQRVGLAPLPQAAERLLPEARQLVTCHRAELLAEN